MNNKTLIAAGVIVIILLLAVWVYLMFFGTPKNPDDIFTDLGFGGGTDSGVVTIPPPPEEPEEPVVNVDRPRLRQLTTKPVIGFVEVQATTTDPILVLYTEAGTGHVYEINLTTGEENRISNTTVAEAAEAAFSPDGRTVAIRAFNHRRAGDLFVNSLATGETATIPNAEFSFTLFSSTTLGYTTRTEEGMRAVRYSIPSQVSSPLFTVPFFETSLTWANTPEATHAVFPKPSYALEGYLYTFTRGQMTRLPASGFGLTAMNTENYLVYTRTSDYTPGSYSYNKATREISSLPIVLIPEKCAPDRRDAAIIWCAHETTPLPYDYPDTWYQGSLQFKDSLWKIDLNFSSAELLVDTFTETNRYIDVDKMHSGPSGSALYFTNKIDNTLWMYEL